MAKEKPVLEETLDRYTEATAVRSQKRTMKKGEPEERLPVGRNMAVPLSQIVLDRYQPRPVLPVSGGLREKFFGGELGWRATAGRWLDLASSDPAVEKQVNELIEMGESIGDLKQIEPATGAWTEKKDGEYKLLLSTGERRFWSLALTAVSKNQEEEPQLICQEINETELGLERQIVENESAKPLSAIGKARAIAGLILEKLDDLPPELDRSSDNPPTDYEYYRSVLDIEKLTGNKYMPRGMWGEIEEIIGMARPHLVRHINLLQFPQELQQMAHLYDLPESVLREALNLPPSQWGKAVGMAAEKDLTAAEVKQIGTHKGKKKSRKITPAEKSARRLTSFWKSTRDVTSEKDIGQLATEFAAGLEQEEILARAKYLESLAQKLRLRAGG